MKERKAAHIHPHTYTASIETLLLWSHYRTDQASDSRSPSQEADPAEDFPKLKVEEVLKPDNAVPSSSSIMARLVYHSSYGTVFNHKGRQNRRIHSSDEVEDTQNLNRAVSIKVASLLCCYCRDQFQWGKF